MIDQNDLMKRINNNESMDGVEVGDIDFHGQRMGSQFVAKGVIFKGTVNFTGTRFTTRVDLRGAKFFGKVLCQSAHFEANADFAFAEFHEEASFERVLFAKHVTFGGTTFEKAVTFENGQFQGEAYFGYTRFSAGAKFSYSRFFDRTFFDGEEKNRVFSSALPSAIVSVVFQKPADTFFRIIDFCMCSLINTDLSQVEITDIRWSIKRGFLDTRKIIYDEISDEANKNYPLIEKAYRQLKKNYENRGSYGEAGDFHYGEMEMRRLSQKGIFRYVSLIAFYKYLSGYGEKYWRAFFWLALFLFSFTSIYLVTGFKAQPGNVDSSATIQYNWEIQLNALFSAPFWRDFAHSFLHTLEVATFQKDRSFVPMSLAGRYLEICQILLVSAQVAFTVLAVGRRFRR